MIERDKKQMAREQCEETWERMQALYAEGAWQKLDQIHQLVRTLSQPDIQLRHFGFSMPPRSRE